MYSLVTRSQRRKIFRSRDIWINGNNVNIMHVNNTTPSVNSNNKSCCFLNTSNHVEFINRFEKRKKATQVTINTSYYPPDDHDVLR